jgi:hypothetical protein
LWFFEIIQNKKTNDLGYFKTFKEPAFFIKELGMNYRFYGY